MYELSIQTHDNGTYIWVIIFSVLKTEPAQQLDLAYTTIFNISLDDLFLFSKSRN